MNANFVRGAVLCGATWLALCSGHVSRAGVAVSAPCSGPGTCTVNARYFGYYTTNWRAWPDEYRPDETFPQSIGAEVIETPKGQPYVQPPKQGLPPALPPQVPPGTPAGPGILPPDKQIRIEQGPAVPPISPLEPVEKEPLPPLPPVQPQPPTPAPGVEPGLPGLGPLTPQPPAPGAEPGLPGLQPQVPGGNILPPLPGTPPSPFVPEPLPRLQPGAATPPPTTTPPPATPAPGQGGALNRPRPYPAAMPAGAPPALAAEGLQTSPFPPAVGSGGVSRAEWMPEIRPAGVTPQSSPAAPPQADVARQTSFQAAVPAWNAMPAWSGTPSPSMPKLAEQAPRAEARPGLGGYCPVELVEGEKWVAGEARWAVEHRGRTYFMSGAEQQKRFLANPDRYAPVLCGEDPVLAIDQQQKAAGQTDFCVVYDGRLYMFSSTATLARFRQNPQRYAAAGRSTTY